MMKKMGRLKKVLILGPLALVLLVAGWWMFENWRGAKIWAEAQKRAEDAGMSLVRADYGGPEIPDSENLLKNPVFAAEFYNKGDDRLRGWRHLSVVDGYRYSFGWSPSEGEFLSYRDYFDGNLTEDEARLKFAKAAEGVEARLNRISGMILNMPSHAVFADDIAHLDLSEIGRWIGGYQNFSRAFKDSALMAIRSGDSQRAFERILVLDRWGEIASGASLVGVLVSNSAFSLELSLIWEGLRLRVWTREQLVGFSELLVERNFRSSVVRAFEYEAAYVLETLETDESWGDLPSEAQGLKGWVLTDGPSGWQDQRNAFIVNFYLDFIEVVKMDDVARMQEIEEQSPMDEWSPVALISQSLVSMCKAVELGCWRPETEKRIALIALAAERQFMAKGEYPRSLGEMELEYPVIDLTDPESRELAYDLGPEGRPQIWSRYQEEVDGEKLRWQFWAE